MSHSATSQPEPISYVSTRGKAPAVSFKTAIMRPLAPDGGLYVPEKWPRFEPGDLHALRGAAYSEVAFEVFRRFVGGTIEDAELRTLIDGAYSNFEHPAVAPLVQIGPTSWILELFHGPTLAFKDFAMQAIAPIMEHFLREDDLKMTILGATSGDTGGAALHAFNSLERVRMLFLFPVGGVSGFQQDQMLGLTGSHNRAVAVEGSFDDCQSVVKRLLNDTGFCDEVSLSAVNSINWGRIVAQTVYYISTCIALGPPENGVSFTVPTGNFGDAYGGFVAKKMGAPISRLVIATNENDTLVRAHQTGQFRPERLFRTITPAIDIQVASNFERLLFDLLDSDYAQTAALMAESGGFQLPDRVLSALRGEFGAHAIDQHTCKLQIASLNKRTGYIADPHTAVGLAANDRQDFGRGANVTLATAHPVKFNESVSDVLGFCPSPKGDAYQHDFAGRSPEMIANDADVVKDLLRGLV